ncbi:MAG: hypothetical protein U9O49_00785 [Candidatus Thermoplasmatota archaeon]|nr:hypothetical protein [Candidatus Thermoplasmatota archaeon]
MEIEIESKRDNPSLSRTEVQFTIKHEGQGTPNREIIRTELAEKLNVKKENVVVNSINSSFGIQETTGYVKIYKSAEKLKALEREYIIKRNKIGTKGKKKKEEKADEEPASTPSTEPPKEETTEEQPAKQPIEGKTEKAETDEKPPVEETPSEEKPVSEPDNTGESPKQEDKPAEEPPKEEAAKEPKQQDEEKKGQS